jgi:hypothetical protein
MGLFDNFFGGSKSSQAPSSVWGPQGTALQGLYSQANPAISGAGAFLQGQLPGLQGPGFQAYNSLANMSQVGNPFVMQQIQGLGQQYGDVLSKQFLPALGSYFGNAGQGRGTVRERAYAAEGARGLGQDFLNASTNLLADSSRQAIGAAGMLPGVGDYLQGSGLQAFLGPMLAGANIYGTGPTVLGGGASSRGPGLGYSALNSFLGGF